MKHTKEEILNALKIIKDECTEIKLKCSDCPFFSHEYGCIIQEKRPEAWDIKKEQEETWRAFK